MTNLQPALNKPAPVTKLEKDAVEEIRAAAEYLIKTVNDRGLGVVGFIFGELDDKTPLVMNFGNCKDADNPELYEELTSMCNEKRALGKAIVMPIRKVN